MYKTVAVSSSAVGHTILLDGKPAKIGAALLQLPSRALAEAVAQEWREQEKHLDPDTMRLTGLARRALTRIATQRGNVIEHILGFGRNELVCYRAADPPELVARQRTAWDPLLEWIRTRYAIRLVADCGISFIDQPVDALVRMQEIVSGLDDFQLAALDAASSLASSFVVALALVECHIDAEQTFAVSHLDELYQAEKWGADSEAQTRRARIAAELRAVEHFVSLLKE